MLKLINTRRHKETLKTDDTCGKHRRKLRSVSGHDSTPKRDVNKTVITSRLQFSFEARQCCCRRNGIERHIDNSRDAACGSGKCRTAKAFPLRASRRVDMNVRIDEPGHNH